jgi:hypothetical protein
MEAAEDEPQPLEVVDNGHHRDAVDAQQLPELVLSQRPAVLELDKNAIVTCLQLQRPKGSLGKLGPMLGRFAQQKAGRGAQRLRD